MDTRAVPTRKAPRTPWIVWVGLVVVLAAAAVLSFDALRGLALTASIPPALAWLLPIAVDAGAAVSCAVWLGGGTPAVPARFAGRMTWSLLAVTVAGNAGQLGMHAHGIVAPWWVAVLVGAIAPAVVGSTIHLVVLLGRSSPDRSTERSGPVADRSGPASTETPEEPEAPEMPELTAAPDGAARNASVDRTDEDLLDRIGDLADRIGARPTPRKVRDDLRIGPTRANRLLTEYDRRSA